MAPEILTGIDTGDRDALRPLNVRRPKEKEEAARDDWKRTLAADKETRKAADGTSRAKIKNPPTGQLVRAPRHEAAGKTLTGPVAAAENVRLSESTSDTGTVGSDEDAGAGKAGSSSSS